MQQRPNLTAIVSPCVGNTRLLMQGPSLLSDPFPSATSALWNASLAYAPNSLKVQLVAAQYFISVYGVEASNFSIGVRLDSKLRTPQVPRVLRRRVVPLASSTTYCTFEVVRRGVFAAAWSAVPIARASCSRRV